MEMDIPMFQVQQLFQFFFFVCSWELTITYGMKSFVLYCLGYCQLAPVHKMTDKPM